MGDTEDMGMALGASTLCKAASMGSTPIFSTDTKGRCTLLPFAHRPLVHPRSTNSPQHNTRSKEMSKVMNISTNSAWTNVKEAQEKANVLRQQAETIQVLVSIGFNRKRVVKAVTENDLSSLEG